MLCKINKILTKAWLMVHHANGQRSDWKVPISDNGWLWAVMQILLFSQAKAAHPIVDTLSWGPPRSKPLIPEQRTQQLTTPYTNMTLITLDLSVTLAFHSVEKCYWDHRWHAAALRSQTHLKRKRWAPLFYAAWLYKSCSAPKNKYGNRVESHHCTKASNPTGTGTGTDTHTCLQ